MRKLIGLKKIMFFSCSLFLIINTGYGQKTLPVYDGFNYTPGTLVYDNTNWWCLNTTPVNDVTVAPGSLSYSGLLGSTANKLSFGGEGDDIAIWFGDQPADTKIYYSFIFQVTDMTGINPGTPAHFAGFSNSATTSGSWGCSIIVQKDATDLTKFNIGHGTRSGYYLWNTVDGTPTGTPVKYSFSTPIFIVACYEIIGTYVAGTPNDKSSMWINPSSSTFEDALAPTASITRDLTGSGFNDLDVLNRFYIRQDAASNTPSIEMDEIRISTTWAGVTPKAIITNTADIFSEKTFANIYPNPVKDVMKVEIKSSDITSLEIHNLIGNRILFKEVSQGLTNIDLSALPSGIYLASFKGNGVSVIKKFIKN
jgi:hypothetical protein